MGNMVIVISNGGLMPLKYPKDVSINIIILLMCQVDLYTPFVHRDSHVAKRKSGAHSILLLTIFLLFTPIPCRVIFA